VKLGAGKEPSAGTEFASSRNGEFVRYIGAAAIANLTLPIFSIFIPLLAVELGASVLEIGIVGGSANLVYSFMPFVMGHFSDRAGARRYFIAGSLAILSAVSVLYFMVSDPITLIAIRLFEGLGWATYWPALEAALTHDPSRDPRKSLTIFNYSWSGAAAVGPLIGSFLVLALSLRLVFLSAAMLLIGITLANFLPILLNRKAPEKPQGEVQSGLNSTALNGEQTDGPSIFDERQNGRKVSWVFYFIAMALCAVSSGILLTFFPPYVKSLGLSILLIGAAPAVYGGVRFLVYLLTVRNGFRYFLLRRETRARNTLALLAMLSLSSLLLTIPDKSGVIFCVSFGIVGAGYSGIYYISQVAMLAEARSERMGAGAGLFESAIGVGAATGPVAAGIFSGSSPTAPFLVPSLVLAPALITLLLVSSSAWRGNKGAVGKGRLKSTKTKKPPGPQIPQ